MLQAMHTWRVAPISAAAVALALGAGCRGDGEKAPSADEAESTAAAEEPKEEAEVAAEAVEQATPGEAAPDFTLVGADGETYTLSDHRGQWVILEWINHDCPFVRKFYGAGKMQELQATYTDADGAGAAWFSIASSGPGQQGHETPERWNERTEENGAAPTAVLIDEEGEVGKRYGARTTPQIVVIDPEGTLVYNGAIDSISSRDPDDIADAENYLEAVMTAVLAGEEPPYTYRDPYGCAVHYGPAS
jgi:peroxiredoxin